MCTGFAALLALQYYVKIRYELLNLYSAKKGAKINIGSNSSESQIFSLNILIILVAIGESVILYTQISKIIDLTANFADVYPLKISAGSLNEYSASNNIINFVEFLFIIAITTTYPIPLILISGTPTLLSYILEIIGFFKNEKSYFESNLFDNFWISNTKVELDHEQESNKRASPIESITEQDTAICDSPTEVREYSNKIALSNSNPLYSVIELPTLSRPTSNFKDFLASVKAYED